MPTSTARRVRSSSQFDQQFGEGTALRVAPELADPVGSFEVGEHEDVEQLGAGAGRPSASRRSRSRRSTSSGLMVGGYAVAGQTEMAGLA
jgi:hypothetical protein